MRWTSASTTRRFEVGVELISSFDLFAAAVAGAMVAALTLFFRFTRTGLVFRAVADDQLAALAVGLRLAPHLGRGVGGVRPGRAGRRPHLGRPPRRAVSRCRWSC